MAIDGLDAEDLLYDLQKEFGLKFDDWAWRDYFNEEISTARLEAILFRNKEPIHRKEKLTVSQLLSAIHRGRL